jgi:hypothetical protein
MAAESASGPGDRVPCLPGGNFSTEDFPATDNTQIEARKPAICSGLATESWPSSTSIEPAPANTRTPAYGQPSPYIQYTSYAAPGGPSGPTAPAPSPSGSKDPVKQAAEIEQAAEILAVAKSELYAGHPELALQILDRGYEGIKDEVVKNTLLANAKNFITAVANNVNKTFSVEPNNPIHAAGLAIRTLNKMHLRPAMAGALLDQTFQGHVEAYSAVQNGVKLTFNEPTESARDGQDLLAQLLAFTANTPQGKQAAASLTKFSKIEMERLIRDLSGLLPPGAKAEFEHLVENTKKLQPQTRVALFSQIENYHDNQRIKEVIENLELLAGIRPLGWQKPFSQSLTAEQFRNSALAGQQRYAKLVAFVTQYPQADFIKRHPGGNRETLDGTLSYILDPAKNTKLTWPDLGQGHGQSGPYKNGMSIIELNLRSMPPGNDKLSGDEAEELALYTFSHEVSHIANKASKASDGSLDELKHELCGGYVGLRGMYNVSLDKQAPPIFSQRDAYVYIYIYFLKGSTYPGIKNTLQQSKKQSEEMRVFIAQTIGISTIDLHKITFDYLLNLDPNTLSKTEPALLPKEINGVPYNFNNH